MSIRTNYRNIIGCLLQGDGKIVSNTAETAEMVLTCFKEEALASIGFVASYSAPHNRKLSFIRFASSSFLPTQHYPCLLKQNAISTTGCGAACTDAE